MKKPTFHGPPEFVGTTVLGERGQIVIPKEVRDAFKLATGAKLVVMKGGKGGNGAIILLPVEQMQDMMKQMTSHFSSIQSALKN